jgi:steroid 5-alpha reductase family enzyme
LLSLITKRNDVADVAWGLGFVVMSWASFLFTSTSYPVHARGLLVSVLANIWGLRLAWHIYARIKQRPEDYRYQEWRKNWGKLFPLRSYLQVFMLQGIFLFIIALPILFINKNTPPPLGWLDLIGTIVWLIGFLFESVGDAQLAQFIKNPANKGRLMQSGLWAYTRHPNYFGEVTQWWGIWIIALSVPHAFATVVGPLMITFLILKVSGIPLLEKKMQQNPEFAAYAKRVSVFIPLPRK